MKFLHRGTSVITIDDTFEDKTNVGFLSLHQLVIVDKPHAAFSFMCLLPADTWPTSLVAYLDHYGNNRVSKNK